MSRIILTLNLSKYYVLMLFVEFECRSTINQQYQILVFQAWLLASTRPSPLVSLMAKPMFVPSLIYLHSFVSFGLFWTMVIQIFLLPQPMFSWILGNWWGLQNAQCLKLWHTFYSDFKRRVINYCCFGGNRLLTITTMLHFMQRFMASRQHLSLSCLQILATRGYLQEGPFCTIQNQEPLEWLRLVSLASLINSMSYNICLSVYLLKAHPLKGMVIVNPFPTGDDFNLGFEQKVGWIKSELNLIHMK